MCWEMWECGCEANVAVSVRNKTPNSSMNEIRRGENKKMSSENDCVWDLGKKVVIVLEVCVKDRNDVNP